MIDPMTGLGLAQALAGINAAMQGQTLADEYNRRITGQYPTDNGPTIGFADYTSDTPAISGDTSGSISTGSGDTPEDAWNDYVETTPSTTVSDTTGGVVSGSKVGTFVYSIMEENPGTARAAAKAIVPVAIPLDAAITAMGQAAGVSIDAANLDAETKQTLVNSYISVSGVVYDKAKGLVTAWKDEWGRILFPKKAFDSVYQTMQDEGIGGDGSISGLVPEENPYDLPSFGLAQGSSDGIWTISTDAITFTLAFSEASPYVGVVLASSENAPINYTLITGDGTIPQTITSLSSYTRDGLTDRKSVV